VAKYKKTQLLDMILTLEKANTTINTKGIDIEGQVLDILTQCQELAILIGNELEQREDAGKPIVKLLEHYCEMIYQQSLIHPRHKAYNKYCKDIRTLLIKIIDNIRNDLPDDKKEIVFLPYKCSMWDSLESIWQAAKNDENFDVYVVPIPYFEKNPDGSLGQMHYEGNEFPEYVPITSWQEFSIPERKPDIIYVHNPYDNCNRVTSIEPEFYAKELKKYTKKLIYVPYFLFPGRFSEHLVALPAVFHADKIFVQNNYIRDGYLAVLEKYIPIVDKEIREKKVVVAGSPKTDKIKNFKISESELELEWKNKINGKKVIFFNTNVSLILHNNERFIDNLFRISETFEKYSNEYVVLWREHPLTLETLKSMRPQILADYIVFKEEFEKKDWVIIDRNKDAYKAMTVSDCYFGAGGSLITIYSITGKPMMVTDYYYPKGISEQTISMEALYYSMGNRLYFNEQNSNSLELFLDNMLEIREKQEERLIYLNQITDNIDGTVGDKIHALSITEEEGLGGKT
jgi:hypothetical protein